MKILIIHESLRRTIEANAKEKVQFSPPSHNKNNLRYTTINNLPALERALLIQTQIKAVSRFPTGTIPYTERDEYYSIIGMNKPDGRVEQKCTTCTFGRNRRKN